VSPVLLQTFGFSISNLLIGVVNYSYYILLGLILAWILIGWFPRYPSNPALQAVYDAVKRIVDPIMLPIRSRIPPLRLGGFALDLSPIIALIGLSIASSLLTTIIDQFIRPVVG
jgi:YggT family protein